MKDTHHSLRGYPRQWGVSGAVWDTVCCRGNCWTALGGNERQLYYSEWKHQAYLVVCSDRVSCANACRKGNNKLSPHETLRMRIYSLPSRDILFMRGQ